MSTFVQWINEQKESGRSSTVGTSKKAIKASHERDRLARLETMLAELVNLKEIIGERRNSNAKE